MPQRKGNLPPQNAFLETIAKRFDGIHSKFLLCSTESRTSFPIIYCSDGFCKLTGFQRSNLMQRSCLFPFAYGTTDGDRMEIEVALREKRELQKTLILYKKNKQPYNCLLDIVPIQNDVEQVVMFLISHKDLPMPESYPLDQSMLSLTMDESEEEDNQSRRNSHNTKELGHRRRSRAVLYDLSENLITKNSGSCFKTISKRLFPAQNASLSHSKANQNKKPNFIILHSGWFKAVWNCFIVVVTLYVAITTPHVAALQSTLLIESNSSSGHHNHHDDETLMMVDLSVEVIFIVDIIFSFLTTYTISSGVVILDRKKIARHYLCGWFIIDLLAAIPFDILAHLDEDLFKKTQPIILLKTLRLARLLPLYQRIDKWREYSVITLSLLMLGFLLVAHWFACVWFAMGWSDKDNSVPVQGGWLRELSGVLHQPFYANGTGGPNTTSAYITSLYFILSSLTSVGFGNVSPNTDKEKLFAICILIVGALMHAVVFGNVTAIIQRIYARQSQYDIRMKDLKHFIRVRRLSKETKLRMISHFQSSWEVNGGVDPDEVLKGFPRNIRSDVAMQIYKEILSLPAFEKAPKGFQRYISQFVRSRKLIHGDQVMCEGDPLLEVIYISKGSLEISKNNNVVGILGKRDLCGANPSSLRTYPCTSQFDLKAKTFSELQCISVERIKYAINMYPQYTRDFISAMKMDFSCKLWRTSNESDSITNDSYYHKNLSDNDWSLQTPEDLDDVDDVFYQSHESVRDSMESLLYFQGDAGDELNVIDEAGGQPENHISDNPNHIFHQRTNQGHCSNESLLKTSSNTIATSSSDSRFNNYSQRCTATVPDVEQQWSGDSLSGNYSNGKNNKSRYLTPTFTSMFSLKPKKKNEEAVSGSTTHPSCFRKSSLLSLQTIHSNNRLDGSFSDTSSVVKRVTFSDEFKELSKKMGSRSLSISGEQAK